MNAGEAYQLGQSMGADRASWVLDGNTSDDEVNALLDGIEDGDPITMDAYEVPMTIGEWGGESAPELGIEGVEDSFLDGYYQGYWIELERIARNMVDR